MKKTLCVILSLALALGLLAACGEPAHDPITDEDEILSILDNHDFWYYAENGKTEWLDRLDDDTRVTYGEELLSMLDALGYDMSDFDGEGFVQAIIDYYGTTNITSIFDAACGLLEIDGGQYKDTYYTEHVFEPLAGGAEGELAGVWNWSAGDAAYEFDGYSYYTYSDGRGFTEGTYTYEGEELVLYSVYDIVNVGYIDGDGDLIIDGTDGWFSPETIDTADFYGCWKYRDRDEWISVYEDGTYEYFGTNGVSMGIFEYIVEDDCLLLPDGLQGEMRLYPTGDGNLNTDSGDWMIPSEQPSAPYFLELGVSDNYEPGWGSVTVPNGTAVYIDDGSEYARMDAEWQIDVVSDEYPGDGTRRLSFVASYLCPISSIPSSILYAAESSIIFTYGLFDYYNGYIFRDPGNVSGPEAGTSYFEFEINGRPVELSIATVNEFLDVYGYVAAQISITVRMPADYDGLVFCAGNAPDSYEEHLETDRNIAENAGTLNGIFNWSDRDNILVCRFD